MEDGKREGRSPGPEGADESDEPGLPVWTEGIVPPKGAGLDDWDEAIHGLHEGDRKGSPDPATDDSYEIIGGEGFSPHEHRFTGDRCEVCGAVRRRRRAA